MSEIVKNFQNIKSSINNSNVNIIAVSKTFSFDEIRPLVDFGHVHFGENKVQEAKTKWLKTKSENSNLQLHMIGKLQSNKAKDAVELFDFIHSVDNKKLAIALAKYEKLLNKNNKYFIQVNIGNENQKSGIHRDQLSEFYLFCKKISLNIIGLMCIPPNDNNSKKYFIDLAKLNNLLKLKEISMGMSADYLDAVLCGSTFVRIGSSIFGDRASK
jgi:pyridoxal phosphate enzyme (YggS family)